MRDWKPLLQRYGVALSALALALPLSVVLGPFSDRIPFGLFIAATLISALHGGLKPGLLATGLSALFLVLMGWIVPGAAANGDLLPRVGLFILVGLLASYLSRECKRAIEATTWFHDTLSVIGDAVILTDPGGRVTFLNPAAHDLIGWTRQDAVGKSFQTVFRLVHEETRQAIDDPVNQVLSTGTIGGQSHHAILITGQGTDRPIDYRATPLRDARGNLAGVFLVFRDISERWRTEKELRQREEQFRTMAASSPACLLVMDASGRCTYSNTACQAAAGFTFEEGIGEGWVRAIHPEDREWLLVDWVGSLRKGRSFAGDVRLLNRQGEVRWFQLRSSPMLSGHGHTIGHVATLEDISLRKRAEQAQESLRKTLQEGDARIQERTAELVQANALLKEQLAERRRVEKDLSDNQENLRKAHEEVERRLQERAAELIKANALIKEHLAGRQQAERELREAQARFEEDLRRQQDGPIPVEQQASFHRERAARIEAEKAPKRSAFLAQASRPKGWGYETDQVQSAPLTTIKNAGGQEPGEEEGLQRSEERFPPQEEMAEPVMSSPDERPPDRKSVSDWIGFD